jgi:glycosyltransferase involved in cell wall biosynthesis
VHGNSAVAGFRAIGYGGPITVIPFGIPPPAAHEPPLAPDGFVTIGCASRYDPEKGLTILIAAMSSLRERFPHVRLVLAGEGPARGALLRLVEELQLGDVVDVREPYDLDPGLAQFMSAIDIYCLPSFLEGQPVSIIEAMAFGKPIVATDVGSVAEMLEGGAGFVVPPRDVARLAGALERLVRDPALRRRMGGDARARFLTRHQASVIVRSHLGFYGQVGRRDVGH